MFEGRVQSIDVEPAKSEAGIETNIVTLAIVRTWNGLANDETVNVRTSGAVAGAVDANAR